MTRKLTAETIRLLDAALRRGDGHLDLYVSYDHGFTAAVYDDCEPDEDEGAGPVAIGHAPTLAEALDRVRHSLGAAVRDAVSVS